MFSRTSEPRSASGGCTPRPRKLMPLSSSTMKPKRKPRSVNTGLSMFGRISTQAMYSRRSPRVRATCTYSRASMFTAMLRAMRNAPGV
ncbi:hypothetical protein D3C81_2094490 [compost metagenome]